MGLKDERDNTPYGASLGHQGMHLHVICHVKIKKIRRATRQVLRVICVGKRQALSRAGIRN